jgi:lysophospholipase L1-like esterase
LALVQFVELIDSMQTNGVEIYGYFHPIPFQIYDNNRSKYADFKTLMKSILKDETKLVDFNESAYDFLTHDNTHFIDHGHLSKKGQQVVLDAILPMVSNN